jgi:hypothetical protein
VSNWAAARLKVLDQHDPLKTVLSVSEDFLVIARNFNVPNITIGRLQGAFSDSASAA